MRGLSQQVRRLYKNFNIPTYYKPVNTLRQQLVRPKDPRKEWWAQSITCHVKIEGRTTQGIRKDPGFDELKRHGSVNSELSRHVHQENPGHSVSLMGSRILGMEQGWFQRGVKESIFSHATWRAIQSVPHLAQHR